MTTNQLCIFFFSRFDTLSRFKPTVPSLTHCRKAASAQQPVGSVFVSECCQPQRERPRYDGSCPAHPDLCHCSNSPAHHAGPPPLIFTCKFLRHSVICMLSACVWTFIQLIKSQKMKHTEVMRSNQICYFGWVHVPSSASFLSFLSSRVIYWAVQRVWPVSRRPSRSPTACAGSSPRWVGSSSWVAIGQWSPKAQMRCTLLRETQVNFYSEQKSKSLCSTRQTHNILLVRGVLIFEP